MNGVMLLRYGDSAAPLLGPIEVTQVAIRSGSGTQDITIPGFGTPAGAFFIMTYVEATNTEETTDVFQSHGATDGTTQWVIANSASTTDVTGRRALDSAVLGVVFSTDDDFHGTAEFDSWITDGVRIDVTDASANLADKLLTVWLFRNDLDVSCGTYIPHTTNVTETVGFETNLLLLFDGSTEFNAAGSNVCVQNYGIASWDGATARQCSNASAYSTPSSIGQVIGRMDDGAALVRYTSGLVESTTSPITFGNVTSTTFDLTASANGTVATTGYLAIGGLGNVWVGALDSPTSTGVHSFTDGSVGFTPHTAIFLPTAQLDETEQTAGRAGTVAFGLATANGEACNSWRTQDNVSNEECGVIADTKAINCKTHSGAVLGIATFDSFVSDGVSVNFSSVDSFARKYIVALAG